jgi:negative regulator of sigma-B (phosphoserine phosphatase)
VRVAVEYVTLPRDGERENGDAALVRRFSDGALVVVLDALGHGAPAAEAAKVAVRHLEGAPIDRGLRPVVESLHEALRGTRGAAAMLLLIRRGSLEGCAVGNVSLRAYRAQVPALLSPGVLGGSLARLHVFNAELSPGARILIFSDGITPRFDEEAWRRAAGPEACRAIITRYRKAHDDATVLVTDIEAA